MIGLTAVTLGLALLTGLPAHSAYLQHVLPAGLLISVGFGLAYPGLAGIAVGSAPAGDAGVASGLFNTTHQVAGARGLALLTHVATLAAEARPPGFTLGAYHLTFGVAAGLSAVALLLVLPPRAACAVGARLDSRSSGTPDESGKPCVLRSRFGSRGQRAAPTCVRR